MGLLPWQCHGIAMALPQHSHGIPMAMPWHCHSTAMVCHGCANGDPLCQPSEADSNVQEIEALGKAIEIIGSQAVKGSGEKHLPSDAQGCAPRHAQGYSWILDS